MIDTTYIEDTIAALRNYQAALIDCISRIEKEYGDSLSAHEGAIIAIKRVNVYNLYYQHNVDGIRSREKVNSTDDITTSLIEREFASKRLTLYRNNLDAVNRFLESVKPLCDYDIADNFHPFKATLISPKCITRKAMIEAFCSKQSALNYHSDDKIHQTKRGELVRSKSEGMIADALYDHDIPYVYEYPLKLKNGKTRFVDFAVLHPKSMKLLFWEHFGMLGDEQYATEALRKIDLYENDDIILGKNLIFTGETLHMPLSTSKVEKTIASFLL